MNELPNSCLYIKEKYLLPVWWEWTITLYCQEKGSFIKIHIDLTKLLEVSTRGSQYSQYPVMPVYQPKYKEITTNFFMSIGCKFSIFIVLISTLTMSQNNYHFLHAYTWNGDILFSLWISVTNFVLFDWRKLHSVVIWNLKYKLFILSSNEKYGV